MPSLRTPCPKFGILELRTNTEFLAAVGMLRKKKYYHHSKVEVISKLTKTMFITVFKFKF